MIPEPTKDQWRALLAVTKLFYEQAPWQWLYDGQLIAVVDQVTGETNYGSIMGNAGAHFALGLYPGLVGLTSFLRIAAADVADPAEAAAEDLDAMHEQYCLMVSFEDRDFLELRDRALLQSLNIRCRGQNSWPRFRRYEPGLFPWYITSAEAVCLTGALQQVMIVADQAQTDERLVRDFTTGQIMTRVQTNGQWTSELRALPLPLPPPAVTAPPVNFSRVATITCDKPPTNGRWEIDINYTTATLHEDKEKAPIIMCVALYVHQDSFFILNVRTLRRKNEYGEMIEGLLEAIEKNNAIPSEVVVCRQTLYQALLPTCVALNIRLTFTPRLSSLPTAQRELDQFLKK